MRWSFTLWGGRFNPIIPIDDAEHAKRLIDLFRVDCLYPVTESPSVKNFIEQQRHITWIDWPVGLVTDQGRGGKESVIADLLRPIGMVYDEYFKHNPQAESLVQLHEWEPHDPLADMLLVSFGALPSIDETAEDYLGMMRMHLKASQVKIAASGPVWPLSDKWTLASFNRVDIVQHYAIRNNWADPGFYVGDVANFADLVNFWNLRATDTQLLFYDQAYADRLSAFRQDWIARAPQSLQLGPDHGLALWHRAETEIASHQLFGEHPIVRRVDDMLWNGRNIQVPSMHFGTAETLASIDAGEEAPSISFPLPDQPFKEVGQFGSQAHIVSVNPGIGLFANDRHTLHLPFIPQLNEFYGRNAFYQWDKARAEPDSLGIVSTARTNHLTIRAVEVGRLITEIFATVGISAEPSAAGLVCSRLITQMGGIDSCRVFRIGGVRDLIEQNAPDQSFTRSHAKRTIFAADTTHPLNAYQSLYIEQRPPGTKLTNDDVLAHLLKKEIFRPGLKLACPNCRLEYWTSVDDLKTNSECEYCGQVANIGAQLKDRDWAFRRSGLFGRHDNQEGAIPVVLTLQQLAHVGMLSEQLQTTAMTLEPKGASIARCETDFVVVKQRNRDHRVQIAIGECKTRGSITQADVRNLICVANAFPHEKFDVFLVFAKLSDFTPEELDYIKEANGDHARRAIILSTRELEPWFVYERTEKEFEIDRHAASFEDMVKVTEAVFFDQRRKRMSEPSVI